MHATLLAADTGVAEKVFLVAIGALLAMFFWILKRIITKAPHSERIDYAKGLTDLLSSLDESDRLTEKLKKKRDRILADIVHDGTKPLGSRSRMLDPAQMEASLLSMEESLGAASGAGALSDAELKNIGMLISGLYNEALDSQFQGVTYSAILTRLGPEAFATESIGKEKLWWELWHTVAKIRFLTSYRQMQRMEVQIKAPLNLVAHDMVENLSVDELEADYLRLAGKCDVPSHLQHQVLKETQYLREQDDAPQEAVSTSQGDAP